MFIDKYRPTKLDQFNFSNETNDKLISLSHSENVPHIILRGRRGSGKRTRALLFLNEKFGPGVFNIKNFQLEVSVPNKKKPIMLNIMASPYHFQFNPSIHGVYDRVLIQKFIDDIIKYKIVSSIPYRVVIIEDADLLTHEAQQSLRRTLETRIKNCRFIFLVNNEGHLIDPIYSRCSIIGVASPSVEHITNILATIYEAEAATSEITREQLQMIARSSNRNLTVAIHTLQKILIENTVSPFKIPIDNNQQVVSEIVKMLTTASDLSIISEIRTNINELFVNGLSGTGILFMLFKTILGKIPKTEIEVVHNICECASDYDNSIRLGGKSMYHIEAFCLHVFREIKLLMEKTRKLKPVIVKKK